MAKKTRPVVITEMVDDENLALIGDGIEEGAMDSSFDDHAGEFEDDEPDHVEVAPIQRQEHVKNKVFYATLMSGTTYTIYGLKFKHMEPLEVPMQYYPKFVSNGWFSCTLTPPRIAAPPMSRARR